MDLTIAQPSFLHILYNTHNLTLSSTVSLHAFTEKCLISLFCVVLCCVVLRLGVGAVQAMKTVYLLSLFRALYLYAVFLNKFLFFQTETRSHDVV